MKYLKSLTIEQLVATLTWSLVSGSAVYFGIQRFGFDHWRLHLSMLLMGFILLAFLRVTSHKPLSNAGRYALLAVHLVSAFGLYWLLPFNHLAIFVVLWSAVVPYFLPWHWCVRLSPLVAAPLWLSFGYYWEQQNAWLSALLFWTFNLFAMAMSRALIREADARQQADELNRELLATQSLLETATRQGERLRIARNIHDLLGHHLTALCINLQVAQHKTSGEAQQQVSRCYSLAKLLLSDVREAVSDIRENADLKWQNAIEVMFAQVPMLKLDLQVTPHTEVNDLGQAETLLRCVQESLTNTLRHSQASQMWLILTQTAEGLALTIKDDGHCPANWQEGNGLTGMRERVGAVGGTISFSGDAQGFVTQINLPECTV
ncbi:hypothetical protein TK45_11290 [Bowmanella sp. JS7-9]|nr:hypothetical protein TK45_11290 [Bowmanella sp. JS7-9]